jgi:hypothetical protein
MAPGSNVRSSPGSPASGIVSSEKPPSPQFSESTACAVACTLPSWIIRAETKVTLRPSRSTSTLTSTAPASGARW